MRRRSGGNGEPPMEGALEDLYPFLGGGGSGGTDPSAAMAEVRESTLRKAREVGELRAALWERHGADLAEAARLVAESAAAGGKVLAFGNGGSATDAQDLVADLSRPTPAATASVPALDLTRDAGVVTAVANDVGFANVFRRQVVAYGEPGDVAVGFSTSGESESVIGALEKAREMGLRTVAFAGYDGGRLGRMAREGRLDVTVVAPSAHIPRIQEAHATAYHAMVKMTRALLAGPDETGSPHGGAAAGGPAPAGESGTRGSGETP